MSGQQWSRSETILAFSLYCKIPFGKIQQTHPDVVDLANMISRTPSSVAMKMCNFASFDPVLKARGVAGLVNASKLDKMIWDEFFINAENLIAENAVILSIYKKTKVENLVDLSDLPKLPEGATKETIVLARINQNFFRKAVLSAYKNTCCITGISLPELLVASHIKPWAISDPKTERTNPQNGLCLNYLHDKAFDCGLMTVDFNYKIRISSKLALHFKNPVICDFFKNYNGSEISLPHRFLPDKKFLEYHNDFIFLM